MPASLLYALKVLTCSRSLERGPEGGITGTTIRILREFRDSKSHDLGFTTGHTILEQLDKLYFMYYPYPPKDLKNHLKKVKRFHLITSADIRKLVQDSALDNLMPLKEFIVKILTDKVREILDDDPFLFLKFQEAFNTNPHAFRRLVEIKTESNPHKIIS